MGAAAAQGAKEYQDRIINDPFDPNYQELYIGRYLSYDDLELSVFVVLADDNPYVQNMAEHIQAIDMLGDRIAVSFDRAMSCYQAGIDDLFWYDCATWQTYWVQENLVYFGDRFVALAANFSYLADDLEPWIGQGVNSDFIYLLREFAAWTDWAGREYQQ
jgi:hypothetical protein